jgi:hypothetical protein
VVTKEEGIPAGLGVAAGVVGLALGAGVAFGLLRSGAKRSTA